METFSRPATLDDLKTLIRALEDHGADYLLIGGYALFAHGYHRATTDIDILVPATLEAGRKVREALMVLPARRPKTSTPPGSRKARTSVLLMFSWLISCSMPAARPMSR